MIFRMRSRRTGHDYCLQHTYINCRPDCPSIRSSTCERSECRTMYLEFEAQALIDDCRMGRICTNWSRSRLEAYETLQSPKAIWIFMYSPIPSTDVSCQHIFGKHLRSLQTYVQCLLVTVFLQRKFTKC